MYGKSKASLWRNFRTRTPPKIFRTILCFVALVYNWYFFQNQPFYGNYSTLDSHSDTNTVISHTFAFSSRWRRKLWQGLFKYDVKEPTLTMFEKSIGHVDPSYSCKWSVFQWGRDFYKCAAIVITKQRLAKGDEPFIWDTIASFTRGKIKRV